MAKRSLYFCVAEFTISPDKENECCISIAVFGFTPALVLTFGISPRIRFASAQATDAAWARAQREEDYTILIQGGDASGALEPYHLDTSVGLSPHDALGPGSPAGAKARRAICCPRRANRQGFDKFNRL